MTLGQIGPSLPPHRTQTTTPPRFQEHSVSFLGADLELPPSGPNRQMGHLLLARLQFKDSKKRSLWARDTFEHLKLQGSQFAPCLQGRPWLKTLLIGLPDKASGSNLCLCIGLAKCHAKLRTQRQETNKKETMKQVQGLLDAQMKKLRLPSHCPRGAPVVANLRQLNTYRQFAEILGCSLTGRST